jgi:GxxExxY protein
MEIIEQDLTGKIIGACLEVSNTLGAGFLESVYHQATRFALEDRHLCCKFQAPLTVLFKGRDVGKFFADILVEGKVILELKAVKALSPEHEAQILNYLKASGIHVGLLINFGNSRLEWKRFVW